MEYRVKSERITVQNWEGWHRLSVGMCEDAQWEVNVKCSVSKSEICKKLYFKDTTVVCRELVVPHRDHCRINLSIYKTCLAPLRQQELEMERSQTCTHESRALL